MTLKELRQARQTRGKTWDQYRAEYLARKWARQDRKREREHAKAEGRQ